MIRPKIVPIIFFFYIVLLWTVTLYCYEQLCCNTNESTVVNRREIIWSIDIGNVSFSHHFIISFLIISVEKWNIGNFDEMWHSLKMRNSFMSNPRGRYIFVSSHTCKCHFSDEVLSYRGIIHSQYSKSSWVNPLIFGFRYTSFDVLYILPEYMD